MKIDKKSGVIFLTNRIVKYAQNGERSIVKNIENAIKKHYKSNCKIVYNMIL